MNMYYKVYLFLQTMEEQGKPSRDTIKHRTETCIPQKNSEDSPQEMSISARTHQRARVSSTPPEKRSQPNTIRLSPLSHTRSQTPGPFRGVKKHRSTFCK